MQHHRSIGTTSLVALMAAHRMVQERALPTPLDPGAIRRIAERLWDSNSRPPGGPEDALATHTLALRASPTG